MIILTTKAPERLDLLEDYSRLALDRVARALICKGFMCCENRGARDRHRYVVDGVVTKFDKMVLKFYISVRGRGSDNNDPIMHPEKAFQSCMR
jgi:hypothetical protein